MMADEETTMDDASGGADMEEQLRLASELAEELGSIFVHYIRGEISFADVTFETFQTLQDLYVIESGDYELVEDREEEDDDMEELANEPVR